MASPVKSSWEIDMNREEFIKYLKEQVELIQQLIEALQKKEEGSCTSILKIDTNLLDEYLAGEEFDDEKGKRA